MSQKIIRQYYLLSLLFTAGGMSIISGTYVTFLQKHGLNFFEVNLVNASFFLTLFICEIPTGAFADVLGRKTAFVTASAILALGMFVYGSAQTFTGFVIAEVIAAVGKTFYSGAFRSWVTDSLKHVGYEGELTRIFSREAWQNQAGGGISAIIGAYLASRNLAWPWFVGGAVMVVVAIMAFVIMREDYFVPEKFSWRKNLWAMKEVAKKSIYYGLNHEPVRFILLTSFLQIYAVQALNMYWQPFFRSRGLAIEYFGFLVAGIQGFLALGAWIGSRMRTRDRERPIILWAQMFAGIMIVCTTLTTGLTAGIIFFLLHEVGRGLLGPMANGYLQERIPSEERATITSFCAIAPHIGGAIGLAVSGAIAQVFGITASWCVGGGVLILGALALRKNGSK